ncbi:glycosyltransferase [Nanoarchaeota archaeon]
MKIAIFSDVYKPMISGVTVSIDNLTKNLVARGHEVKVFTVNYPKKAEPPKGVTVDYSRGVVMPTYKEHRMATPSSIRLLLKARKFRPDVLHAMTPFGMGSQAMIISKALNIPIIYTEHSIYPDFVKHISLKSVKGFSKIDLLFKNILSAQITFTSIYGCYLISFYKSLVALRMNKILKRAEKIKVRKSIKRQLRKFMSLGLKLKALGKRETYRSLKPRNIKTKIKSVSARQYTKLMWSYFLHVYNQSDLCSTPSQAMKNIMLYHGAKTKVIPISNGIDRTVFKKKKVKKSKNFKIIHVGRIAFEKNIDVTIKAVAEVIKKHPSVKFDIIGNGPQINEMKQLVKDLKLTKNIKFKGQIKNTSLPNHYSAAHLFVTASTIETEGLVMLEAMSCGIPVVAVDKLACPYVVKQGKNGYIAPVGDYKKMAFYIEKLIKNKTLLNKLSKTALEMSRNYDLQCIVTRWEKIYSDVIKNYKKKRKK